MRYNDREFLKGATARRDTCKNGNVKRGTSYALARIVFDICFLIRYLADAKDDACFTQGGAWFHAQRVFVDVNVPRIPFWTGCGRLPAALARVVGPPV